MGPPVAHSDIIIAASFAHVTGIAGDIMRITLVIVCAAMFVFLSSVVGCSRTHPVDPEMVILDGKPISTMLPTAPPPPEDPEARRRELRKHIADDMRIRSLANPVGRGELRRLSGFRYVFREAAPGTVKSIPELQAVIGELQGALEQAKVEHGRPFLFIPEPASGWLFNEVVRVCLPLPADAQAPSGMPVDELKTTMVVFQPRRTLPPEGKLDEMERWAEKALEAAAGGPVDFSGPFIIRTALPDGLLSDPEGVDWMAPSAVAVPVPGRTAEGGEPAEPAAEEDKVE